MWLRQEGEHLEGGEATDVGPGVPVRGGRLRQRPRLGALGVRTHPRGWLR